jgi:pimeloyl-ACP methyl ester carboxylesterase
LNASSDFLFPILQQIYSMAFIIDKTVRQEINGSTQKIRMCAEREGLHPLLIVQAGPGFPLLHEAAKFQRLLRLEKDFLVSYWDQRGCGNASLQDAESVSLEQQVDDLCAVLRWLKNETRRRIMVVAVSLGATFALQAAERERDCLEAVVALSLDAQIASSDASVSSFLKAQSAHYHRLNAKLMKLGEPPYIDPAKFQLRARLLTDLGCIERGKGFGRLLREMLYNMVGTYGLLGTAKTLKNMSRIQRKMLPQLASLDLLANPPRLAVPVHFVIGQQDPLVPTEIIKQLSAAMTVPGSTLTELADAGHMVHFDQPEAVRSIILAAAVRNGA